MKYEIATLEGHVFAVLHEGIAANLPFSIDARDVHQFADELKIAADKALAEHQAPADAGTVSS